MAKVATAPPSGATTSLKRKTPSEMRVELLKRKGLSKNVGKYSASVDSCIGLSIGVLSEIKKPDQTKSPKYIDTRMDHLFPVRKNSTRLSLPSDNRSVKDNRTGITNNSLAAESLLNNMRSDQTPASASAVKDCASEPFNTIGKCSANTFRTVTELSNSGEKLPAFSNVDMHKALKGLIMPGPLLGPLSQAHSSGEDFHRKPPNSDIQIPGNKTPLDLTLKTSMRIVSSSSIRWFHRAVNCNNTQLSWSASVREQDLFHSSGAVSSSQAFNKICSWVYPQSPLPPVVISALSLAVGDGGQMDFLNKRQQAWEDAFRSLYYMLRKKICNVFYVCTTQFVVMFTGSDNLKTERRNCNAYISQSTRGLRSLLKEHDISYSMPLCQSKPEEVTAEDLVELSEIDKQNLGQARNTRNMSDIDKTPQSLLVFSGNENVHGLYEFLLNYRYYMTSMTGLDVPILCSPVPFENAALSAPEIRCKELRKADHLSMLPKETITDLEANQGSSNICYSIEIKDAYLPPWVICGVCDAIGADGNTFEASFVPETTSIGLNVGLDIFHQDSDVRGAKEDPLQNNDNPFGINNAVFSPHIRSGYVKGLKFRSDSYIASVSTV
ncbi:hypothetical protein LIER_21986 [Lithospermum erythrorhizon]|uniref:Protein downstream neighbor of Son n=1 Tax=Lithospermum erythrorhizon TaxID=34254 RepID=A0AAV3QS59_LITER